MCRAHAGSRHSRDRSVCRELARYGLKLESGVDFETLLAARRWQCTDEFRRRYAARAGIEATHAQAVRRKACDEVAISVSKRRDSRHMSTAAAVNLLRISAWCSGTSAAKPRSSHFAALFIPPPLRDEHRPGPWNAKWVPTAKQLEAYAVTVRTRQDVRAASPPSANVGRNR